MRRRLEDATLRPIRHGVYSFGHVPLGIRGEATAAVLAHSPSAILSHRSAAWLHELSSRGTRWTITTTQGSRSHDDIKIHRVRSLPDTDRTTRHNIPCTTIPRTLVDLAASEPRRFVERALEQLEASGRYDHGALIAAIEAAPSRAGAKRLNEILAGLEIGQGTTRNDLEEAFLAICQAASIPRPATNVPMTLPDGTEVNVDCLWHKERLVVELDGRQTHGTRAAFERDRHRDNQHQIAGYRAARFTWLQLTGDPAGVAQTVAALLASRPR